MRLLMYIFGALPYEFQYEIKISPLVLLWRFIHLILVTFFVIWISVLRFRRFHEVLYEKNDMFSNVMDMISYATLIILHAIIYWENTWKAYKYKFIFENVELIRNKFKVEFKRLIDIGRIRLYAVLLYNLFTMYMIVVMFNIFIRYIKSLNGFRLILLQYGDTILKFKLIEFSIFAAIVVALQEELNNYLKHFMNEIQKSQNLKWSLKRKVFKQFYVLQEIHNILITTVRYIEEYCYWSLPGLILKMFFEFTITAYWIYFSFDFKIPALFTSCKSLVYVFLILKLILVYVNCRWF